MPRAFNFEEWSGELSDPESWIEFADGSATQTPLQVFAGWVNYAIPLIDRVVRLEAEVSNLRAAEIGYSRSIKGLESQINGLEGKNRIIPPAPQQSVESTTLIAPVLVAEPAPVAKPPAPAEVQSREELVRAEPAAPPAKPEISDDEVREMCAKACQELKRRNNSYIVKYILEHEDNGQAIRHFGVEDRDKLFQRIKKEFHIDQLKNQILKDAGVNKANEDQKRMARNLAKKVLWDQLTSEQAVEEFKNPPVEARVVGDDAAYNKAKSDLEAAATQLGLDLSKASVQTVIEENADELAPLALNNQDAEYNRRISVAAGTLAKMK